MNNLYFEKVKEIGNLYLERVFTRLEDENILFVCKSENNERYLCLCYEFRFSLKWLVCKISTQDLLNLINKKKDIRSIYEISKDKIINIIYKDENENSELVNFEQIKDTIIPRTGIYMKENIDISEFYIFTLMFETNKIGIPQIHNSFRYCLGTNIKELEEVLILNTDEKIKIEYEINKSHIKNYEKCPEINIAA